MRINHAAQICALSPSDLEEFVDDWLAQRCKDYHGHELWRGTGDMGRDVTGYVTARRLEGEWDNFQCKQLTSRLSERSAFVELGKLCGALTDSLADLVQPHPPLAAGRRRGAQ